MRQAYEKQKSTDDACVKRYAYGLMHVYSSWILSAATAAAGSVLVNPATSRVTGVNNFGGSWVISFVESCAISNAGDLRRFMGQVKHNGAASGTVRVDEVEGYRISVRGGRSVLLSQRDVCRTVQSVPAFPQSYVRVICRNS